MKNSKIIKLASLYAGLLTLGVGSFAHATDQALLDALVANGTLTAEQASQISEDSKVSISPNRGTVKELRVRGRIQGQFGYSTGDGDRDYSTMEIRRARFGVQGSLHEPYRFQIELNTLPGGVSLDSAYVRYTGFGPEANLEFGKGKPRFGHEENTSSASILTIERSLLSNTLNGGKPVGARLFGDLGVIDYYTGIYNGHNSGAVTPNGEAGFLYNASIGLSLDEMIDSDISLNLRGDLLYNDADFAGSYGFEDAYAVSAHLKFDPVDVRIEYMYAKDFDGDSTRGFYIMPSMFFVPDTLEGVIRYEYVKADEASLQHQSRYARRQNGMGNGDRYQALYFGVNYYVLGNNLKYMAGVEFADLDVPGGDDTDATTLYGAMRMQF
ncbi:MAG: hypothetical protein JJT75_14295 [Opitutales bacterium]|nr:hypothetical protein [Opitutales bacterium]MCH8541249.1 OprO/OprP family phosphate-selective porin [Opitutales bacterium]